MMEPYFTEFPCWSKQFAASDFAFPLPDPFTPTFNSIYDSILLKVAKLIVCGLCMFFLTSSLNLTSSNFLHDDNTPCKEKIPVHSLNRLLI